MVLAGRMTTVHKPYPEEFRRDVIAVARQGGQTRAQIAAGFGISESCLGRWLRIADREDGKTAPSSGLNTAAGADLETENRELRKRAKQLEQENEVLRRATAYFARDVLPK
jgi:transposase